MAPVRGLAGFDRNADTDFLFKTVGFGSAEGDLVAHSTPSNNFRGASPPPETFTIGVFDFDSRREPWQMPKINSCDMTRSNPVPKTDLGKKLTCPDCGARFYDLGKSPATCPKCEHTFDAQPVLKPKRQPAAEPKKKVVAKVEEEAEEDDEDEDLLEIDDDDDDLLPDPDDDDDDVDDDDVAEVKEHIEVEKEDT